MMAIRVTSLRSKISARECQLQSGKPSTLLWPWVIPAPISQVAAAGSLWLACAVPGHSLSSMSPSRQASSSGFLFQH